MKVSENTIIEREEEGEWNYKKKKKKVLTFDKYYSWVFIRDDE